MYPYSTCFDLKVPMQGLHYGQSLYSMAVWHMDPDTLKPYGALIGPLN